MVENNFIQKKQGGRPSKCPELTVLNELYVSHTAREIAEEYGVSINTVRGWIRRGRQTARERGGLIE